MASISPIRSDDVNVFSAWPTLWSAPMMLLFSQLELMSAEMSHIEAEAGPASQPDYLLVKFHYIRERRALLIMLKSWRA